MRRLGAVPRLTRGADTRPAFAAVLEVPTEDIAVRDRSQCSRGPCPVAIGTRSAKRIQKSKELGILIDYGLGQEPRDPGLTWRPAKGVGGEVGPMPPRSLRYSYGSRIHWMRPRFRAGFPLRIFTVACRTTLPLATGTSSSHPPLLRRRVRLTSQTRRWRRKAARFLPPNRWTGGQPTIVGWAVRWRLRTQESP